MKNIIFALICLVVTACSKPMIVSGNCAMFFAQCKQSCEDNCPDCMRKSINSAMKSYGRYVHEQKVQGGMVIQELKSYRDPLQCRKVSCNCMADYNVCVQGMSGIIHKRLQVNPACER